MKVKRLCNGWPKEVIFGRFEKELDKGSSRVGKTGEVSVDTETAIARGRDAIDSWTLNTHLRAGAIGSAAPPGNTRSLTPREQEVLALIVGGCSNKEGGYRLGISTRTFEAHRARLMGKLGARNAADLIRKTSNQNQ